MGRRSLGGSLAAACRARPGSRSARRAPHRPEPTRRTASARRRFRRCGCADRRGSSDHGSDRQPASVLRPSGAGRIPRARRNAPGGGSGAHLPSMGDRGGLQRQWPLWGRAGGGAAGCRGFARARVRDVGNDRGDRGSDPEWGGRAGSRALERLSETPRASGSDWALGVEACGRALLSDGETAEGLYREALDRLGRTRIRMALARAHLLYGEWLRRARRRTDARDQLRTAHEMLVTMGADGFAERAGRELLATGERARQRVVETSSELTAQEAQVARLARDGLANAEIGARLFISPRTVQY